jgi:hypothetical protein
MGSRTPSNTMASNAAMNHGSLWSTTNTTSSRPRKLNHSRQQPTDLESTHNLCNYSASASSKSSFSLASTSTSTDTTSISDAASSFSRADALDHFPSNAPPTNASATWAVRHWEKAGSKGIVGGSIDPRLTFNGSTSYDDLIALNTEDWTESQPFYGDNAIDEMVYEPLTTTPTQQLDNQSPANDFGAASNEVTAVAPELNTTVAIWLTTWLAASANRFPDKRELKGLRALCGLSDKDILAWLGHHILPAPNTETEALITCSDEDFRRRRTRRYRVRCRLSSSRFRYVTDPSETRIFECTNRCGQSFDRKGQWTRHERSNVEEWKCQVCPFLSPRKEKLQKHLKEKKHGSNGVMKGHCRPLLEASARPCGFCLMRFDTWSVWLNHVAAHFEGRIPGGPWTMVRWNRTVDVDWDTSSSEDDGDDDDDSTDEGSGDQHDFAGDNGVDPSTKDKDHHGGGGSRGPSRTGDGLGLGSGYPNTQQPGGNHYGTVRGCNPSSERDVDADKHHPATPTRFQQSLHQADNKAFYTYKAGGSGLSLPSRSRSFEEGRCHNSMSAITTALPRPLPERRPTTTAPVDVQRIVSNQFESLELRARNLQANTVRKRTNVDANTKKKRSVRELLQGVWDLDPAIPENCAAAYIDHFKEVLLSLHEPSNSNLALDAGKAVEIVSLIRSSHHEPLQGIRDNLQGLQEAFGWVPANEEFARKVITFALRLWLFTDAKDFQWSQNLRDVVCQSLSLPVSVEMSLPRLLSSDFSAKNLTRIGGMKVIWTNYLSEHLRIVGNSQLKVFRHASVLHEYANSDIR